MSATTPVPQKTHTLTKRFLIFCNIPPPVRPSRHPQTDHRTLHGKKLNTEPTIDRYYKAHFGYTDDTYWKLSRKCSFSFTMIDSTCLFWTHKIKLCWEKLIELALKHSHHNGLAQCLGFEYNMQCEWPHNVNGYIELLYTLALNQAI